MTHADNGASQTGFREPNSWVGPTRLNGKMLGIQTGKMPDWMTVRSADTEKILGGEQ